MGFYNDLDATKQARDRLGLAAKLVDRMRKLNRPCSRRDLVRALNNQRLDEVGPVIDTLLGIGVFTSDGKLLMLCPEAKPLLEQDFMESTRCVWAPTAHSRLWLQPIENSQPTTP
jgi:hypothetical protein